MNDHTNDHTRRADKTIARTPHAPHDPSVSAGHDHTHHHTHDTAADHTFRSPLSRGSERGGPRLFASESGDQRRSDDAATVADCHDLGGELATSGEVVAEGLRDAESEAGVNDADRGGPSLDVSQGGVVHPGSIPDACAFVVANRDPASPFSRGCARDATASVGPLRLCWQHKEQLIGIIGREIRTGEPEYGFAEGELTRVAREQIKARDWDRKQNAAQEKEAARRAASVVYFVEREGFVKIGFSATLKRRLADISKGSAVAEGMTVGPVRLLATLPGGRPQEDYLHGKFKHLRMAGEWFLLDDDLWEFITGLRGYAGEPRTVRALVGAA